MTDRGYAGVGVYGAMTTMVSWVFDVMFSSVSTSSGMSASTALTEYRLPLADCN